MFLGFYFSILVHPFPFYLWLCVRFFPPLLCSLLFILYTLCFVSESKTRLFHSSFVFFSYYLLPKKETKNSSWFNVFTQYMCLIPFYIIFHFITDFKKWHSNKKDFGFRQRFFFFCAHLRCRWDCVENWNWIKKFDLLLHEKLDTDTDKSWNNHSGRKNGEKERERVREKNNRTNIWCGTSGEVRSGLRK